MFLISGSDELLGRLKGRGAGVWGVRWIASFAPVGKAVPKPEILSSYVP